VDLAHDPSGNLVYVGSSSGGVWKSTDGLSPRPQFVPISEQAQSLSVGALALDSRTNPPTIYVGTGAPDNSANISSYTGTGILISRDGGRRWTLIEGADGGTHPFAGMGFSRILVDPTQPNILLASTGIGSDPNHPATSVPQGNPAFDHLGIYRSTDAGQTWKQVRSASFDADSTASRLAPDGYFHIELLYDPAGDRYLAGVSNEGLFVSMDRGATWAPLQSIGWGVGLPATAKTYRVSLAARGNTLWAFIMTDPHNAPSFGLFQSVDHGRTWLEDVTQRSLFGTWGFLMYVAAPPASNELLIAGEFLFRKTDVRDPAQPWTQIGVNVLHADQHAIAFADATHWYVGNDGGVWATADGGNHWTSLNQRLRTLEFHSAAADSGAAGTYVGGMQDNGTAFLTSDRGAWTQVYGGDGAFCAADPGNPGAFFLSGQYGDVQYGRVASSLVTGGFFAVDATQGKFFLTPYEIIRSGASLFAGVSGFSDFDVSGARVLLTGTTAPWLVAYDPDAPAGARNHVAVELADTIGDAIQYIAPFPADPTSAYVVAGGRLFLLTEMSFAGRAKMTPVTGDPVNGDLLGHLAVTSTGTLYLSKVGLLDGQKLFKRASGATKWINISGNLPNVPVNWVVVDGASEEFVYVATTKGVYVATDGGVANEQWKRLGDRLPNVPVTQLQRSQARKLIAATFGRGVWSLDVRGAVPGNLASVQLSPASVTSGSATTGTVTLTAPVWVPTRVGLVAVDPGQGQLGHKSTLVTVQSEVSINAGETQATFPIQTAAGSAHKAATIYATAGVTMWTTLTLT
jgi:photosystem II stability/assembly factor-like uncharacterized protein